MDLDKLLTDDTTSEEIAKEKLSDKPVKKKETRGHKKVICYGMNPETIQSL